MNAAPSRIGFAYILSDMVLMGVFFVASHYFTSRFHPYVVASLVTLFGALPLLIRLAIRGTLRTVLSLGSIARLTIIAFLSAAATLVFFIGTSLSSAVNTGILSQVEPIYSLILAALFLDETMNRRQVFSTLLMIAGAVIVSYRPGSGVKAGDLLLLLAPLLHQCSHLVAKSTFRMVPDITIVPAARLLIGGVALTLLALIVEPSSFETVHGFGDILLLVCFGAIFRGLDLFLWYHGIALIPLAMATALLPLSVVTSLFGAVLVLNESIAARQVIGVMLIFFGLVLLSRKGAKGAAVVHNPC